MRVTDPPFTDPGIPDGERTAYRGVIANEQAGQGSMTIEAGQGSYVQRVEAELETGFFLELEMRFAVTNRTLRAASYRLETRDGDKPVAREEGWFRDVRALHWGGDLEPYPGNVTPLLGCALALRGLEFEKGERHHLALWLANSVWWEVATHVERREKVSVPAGEFDAWRVSVKPQFDGLGGTVNRVIGAILPPFRLHFDAEPPHRFLRFSFPTGPFPWNPRGLIEATEL